MPDTPEQNLPPPSDGTEWFHFTPATTSTSSGTASTGSPPSYADLCRIYGIPGSLGYLTRPRQEGDDMPIRERDDGPIAEPSRRSRRNLPLARAEDLVGKTFTIEAWEDFREEHRIPNRCVRCWNGIVRDSSREDIWELQNGEHCLVSEGFCCGRCGHYYLRQDPRSTRFHATQVDLSLWCAACVDSFGYTWEDGSRHTRPEPGLQVSGYHEYMVDPEQPCLLAPDVQGIEMETYWENPKDILKFSRENNLKPDTGWKFERDGSLSGSNGVEIVAHPLRYELLIREDDTNTWWKMFQYAQGKSYAWSMGPGYGTHISVNGSTMSQAERIKFSRFINGCPELCQAIAGRTASRWSRFVKPQNPADQHCNGEKYLACAMRSDSRLEVRIFRASWNWKRMLRNIQFVESVRRYTKECRLSDADLCDDAYLSWLDAQPSGEFADFRQWMAEVAVKDNVVERKLAQTLVTSRS